MSSDIGEALADTFLSMCTRADVDWPRLLVGVSAEAAGLEGEAFVRCLEAEARAPLRRLVNAGLSLEDRVAAACYDRLCDVKNTSYQVAVSFFSTMDFLRRLFAVNGAWFALLTECCESLRREGADPWQTYTGSICFVWTERLGVWSALNRLLQADPRQYQNLIAVISVIDPTGPESEGFTVCLAVFRDLFDRAGKFFEQVGIPF